jgi:hypothetical protein
VSRPASLPGGARVPLFDVIACARTIYQRRSSTRNFFMRTLFIHQLEHVEAGVGFGPGALLWLIGVPIPILILLAIFMHH